MTIQELEALHYATKRANVTHMVHGTWTGLSAGHTDNCYGFARLVDAESFASQLNIREGWENEEEKYVVTPYCLSDGRRAT